MTRKNRFIILVICFIAFCVITPYVLLYALGYRIDFEDRKLVAIGGIYVRALPQGSSIFVDSKQVD